MYVAALKGLSEKQAHKKATELLEAVDLAEKKKPQNQNFLWWYETTFRYCTGDVE